MDRFSRGAHLYCSAGGRLQCTTLKSASALVKQQGRQTITAAALKQQQVGAQRGSFDGPEHVPAAGTGGIAASSRGVHAVHSRADDRPGSNKQQRASSNDSNAECQQKSAISNQSESVRQQMPQTLRLGARLASRLASLCEFSTHMLYCALLSHTLRMPVRLQSPLRFDAIAGGRTTGHY